MWINIPDQTKVIARYGADAQALIHAEELAELIQAASKMRRAINGGKDTSEAYENLVEEIADLLVCMEQIQEMYGIHDHEIQRMVDKKCVRLEAKINGHV